MAKMTLLAIVQNILSDMDSDPVNSINDTMEAQQVASIVETTYREITSNDYWKHLRMLTKLEASGDNTKPVWMKMPENVQYVEEVRYNTIESGDTADTYELMTPLTPEEFLELVQSRNEDATEITQYTDYNGTPLLIYTDRAPTYYTSFDEEYLVFDAYDNAVDTTLQSSKTQILAYKEVTWDGTDTGVPDLPAHAFPYLLAEAKSVCFANLKQYPNAKEEQKSRRQRIWLKRKKWRQNGGIKFPNYGRNV